MQHYRKPPLFISLTLYVHIWKLFYIYHLSSFITIILSLEVQLVPCISCCLIYHHLFYCYSILFMADRARG